MYNLQGDPKLSVVIGIISIGFILLFLPSQTVNDVAVPSSYTPPPSKVNIKASLKLLEKKALAACDL